MQDISNLSDELSRGSNEGDLSRDWLRLKLRSQSITVMIIMCVYDRGGVFIP